MARHSPRTTTTPSVHGADKHINVTRELFLPALAGHIALFGSPGCDFTYGAASGPANERGPQIYLTFKVPDDFVSFGSLAVVWFANSNGSMYWDFGVCYAASGEPADEHTEGMAYKTTPTDGPNRITVTDTEFSLTNIAKGDFVGLWFFRDGSNAADTLNTVCYVLGFLFTYIAEQ